MPTYIAAWLERYGTLLEELYYALTVSELEGRSAKLGNS